MTDAIIQVQDFRKTYGSFVAVDGISFDVQRGEIFGLLGPNGAGKTSTLESLEGLRWPDGGELRIAGIDPSRQARQLRALIGVQLQTSGLPDSFRVDEAMRFFCAYHGVAPRDDLIDRVGLNDKRATQYHQLGGQRAGWRWRGRRPQPPVVFLTN
jgi:ABC-2 type transport system ATP-binding protein